MRYLLIVLFIVFAPSAYAAEWIELSDTKLMSVAYDWSPDPVPGTSQSVAAVYAFSGAAFDTTRNRLLIHGGGHADYGGQEIYAFDIDTFTWSMVASPENYADLGQHDCTSPSSINYGYRTANNLPKSVHTYDRLVYVEQLDSLFDGRGSIGYIGCEGLSKESALFNFTTNQWEWWADPIQQPGDTLYPSQYPLGGAGSAAAVHPTTKEIWFVPRHAGRIIRWNPTTNVFTPGRSDNHLSDTLHKMAVIDTNRNHLIISKVNNTLGLRLYQVPLDDFSGDTRAQEHLITTTGDNDFIFEDGGRRITFDYDPVDDRLVAWAGGSDIYTLNLDTLVWTQHTIGGAVPGIPGTGGVYGRFRYVDSIDRFLLTRSANDNVFLLDLRGGQPVTTIELTSEISGTVPFTTAVGFKKRDVLTTPTLDLENYQVEVKRHWPDGSVKHAVFSGTYQSTAKVPTTITVLSGGELPTGIDLTEADIVAAAPTAVVDLGSHGTASLTPLLGSPERIWLQGPEMIEAHYHTLASNDSDLSVWFHVRLYAGGEVRVRTIVEYGYADRDGDPKGYRPIFTVGGNVAYEFPVIPITDIVNELHPSNPELYRQVFTTSVPHDRVPDDGLWVHGVEGMTDVNDRGMRVSYSGEMTEYTFRNYYDDVPGTEPLPDYTGGGEVWMAHFAHTRWTAIGWSGVADPKTTVRHDTDYMQESKLVLNYWQGPPGNVALNTLAQEYSPMRRGNWRISMGSAGFHRQIGILSNWDALYITSGGDPRAFNAVETNSASLNTHAIIWSDPTTYSPIVVSEWPDKTVVHGTGLGNRTLVAGESRWEYNHHGSGGYMAYLITGDYFHYDTMAHQGGLLYLAVPTGDGLGINRVLRMETRGTAWALRSLGQLVGIGPVGDPVLQDFAALIETSVAYHGQWIGVEGIPETGHLYTRYAGAWTGYDSTFMAYFMAGTLGHISDLELDDVLDTAPLIALRNHIYKIPVGALGGGGAENYCFIHASSSGGVRIAAGDDKDINDPRTWLKTWGEIWKERFGEPNPDVCGTTLQMTSPSTSLFYGSTNTWGNLLPAIAYAVEHGAPGAAEAFARFQGADNWLTFENSGFEDVPVWGVWPRNEHHTSKH